MESELKGLNSKPAKQDRNDGPASKDDRPLLKPDPASSVSAEELQELEKKCAAYVRRDVYGTMGRGELPVKEKVLLGLAMVTLVPIRVVLATTLLVLFLICQICTICTLFKVPNRDEQEQEDYAHMRGWRRTVIVQCGRTLSRAMLFVFGFYWINEPYRIPNPNSFRGTCNSITLDVRYTFEEPAVLFTIKQVLECTFVHERGKRFVNHRIYS